MVFLKQKQNMSLQAQYVIKFKAKTNTIYPKIIASDFND